MFSEVNGIIRQQTLLQTHNVAEICASVCVCVCVCVLALGLQCTTVPVLPAVVKYQREGEGVASYNVCLWRGRKCIRDHTHTHTRWSLWIRPLAILHNVCFRLECRGNVLWPNLYVEFITSSNTLTHHVLHVCDCDRCVCVCPTLSSKSSSAWTFCMRQRVYQPQCFILSSLRLLDSERHRLSALNSLWTLCLIWLVNTGLRAPGCLQACSPCHSNNTWRADTDSLCLHL